MNSMMRSRWMQFSAAMTLAVTSLGAQALPIVPGNFAMWEGPTNNAIPFDPFFGTRYQQIYDASGFNGASGLINSIAFRLDGIEGRPVTNFPFSFTLTLSNTTRSSQTLSSTFADNVGADAMVVFNGTVNFSAGVVSQGPNPFDLLIDFDRGFLFDGLQNLLIDFTLLDPLPRRPTPVLDASNGGPFGRVFGQNGAPSGFADNGSLITQFDITPASVPEPSMAGLFLGGLGLLAWRRRASQRARDGAA